MITWNSWPWVLLHHRGWEVRSKGGGTLPELFLPNTLLATRDICSSTQPTHPETCCGWTRWELRQQRGIRADPHPRAALGPRGETDTPEDFVVATLFSDCKKTPWRQPRPPRTVPATTHIFLGKPTYPAFLGFHQKPFLTHCWWEYKIEWPIWKPLCSIFKN